MVFKTLMKRKKDRVNPFFNSDWFNIYRIIFC